MQFNQAIPATWALTLGDALAVIMLDSERARLLYEVAAKNAIVEGEAAQKSANAIKDSYDKQADATLLGAIGDISQASTSAVGEGAGIYLGAKYNSQISKTQTELDNVTANKEFIDNAAENSPAALQAARAGAPGSPIDRDSLETLPSTNLRKGELSQEEKAKIQGAAQDGENRQFLEKLQSNAAKERNSLDDRLKDLNTQKQQAGQSWRSFAQYSGMALKSGFTFGQAAKQYEAAVAQKTQVIMNFFSDMTKTIQSTLQSSIDATSSQMLSKSGALIRAIAESNRA